MISGESVLVFIGLGLILYFIIRQAVEDGMLSALKKYDDIKNKDNDIEKNSFNLLILKGLEFSILFLFK